MRGLPISHSTEDVLVSADGAAVWPVRSASDRRALSVLASVFGGQLEAVSASRSVSAPADELVVGLGEQHRAAELYAHLTARRAMAIRSIDELADLPEARVLLCTPDDLTFNLLTRSWEHGRDHHPLGLVVADGEQSMRRQVLLRSAAAWLSSSADPAGVTLSLPDLDLTELTVRGMRLLGRHASAASVAAALSDGADIAAVYAHGDGLDSHLGDGKVTCSVKHPPNRAAPLPPDCVTADFCHRLNVDIEDARHDPRMIDSGALRCRIAVALTCFGIAAKESIVPWEWSMLWSRLKSGRVGAIITTWGLTTRAQDGFLWLTEELASGSSVGTAMARSYEVLGDDAQITRLCLFGDPRVHAAGALESLPAVHEVRALLATTAARSSGPPPPLGGDVMAARARLLTALTISAEADEDLETARLARDATLRLSRVTRLHGAQRSSELVERTGIAVLRVLARIKTYQRLAQLGESIYPTPSSDECMWCSSTLRAIVHRRTGAADRLEHWCDRCGLVLNAERQSQFVGARLAFDGRTLRFPPSVTSVAASSMFVLERPATLSEIARPAGSSPRLIHEVAPGQADIVIDGEVGVRRCALLLVKDLEIALLQGVIRCRRAEAIVGAVT